MTRPSMTVTTRYGATPLCLALLLCAFAATAPLLAASAGDLYTEALSRERGLRAPADTPATLTELRRDIERYEAIVRQYPRSGYSDNALWQAAGLALEEYDGYGDVTDQQHGERLLRLLASEYPSNSLVPRVAARLAAPVPGDAATPTVETPVDAAMETSEGQTASARTGPVSLRSVTRETLADVVRVTLELDDEVPYFSDYLDGPARLYFDLTETDATASLRNATLPFDDGDIVREIRMGRQTGQTTRVVIDVEGVESYSIYALYNPYRLVVDSVRLPELRILGASDPGPTAAEVVDEPQTDPWVPEAVEPALTVFADVAPEVEAPRADLPDPADEPLIEPVDVVVDAMPGSKEPSVDAPPVLGLDLLPVPEGWASRPLAPIDPQEPVEVEEGLAIGRSAAGPTPEDIVAMVPADDPAWPRDHDLLYPNLGTPPVTPSTSEVASVLPVDESVAEVMPTSMAHVAMADIPEPIAIDAQVELLPDVREPNAVSPVPPAVVLTDAPSLTADGAYSLGRQLGLGISRIVIDPGHGGYDPGARSGDLAEAALVLDVAERLEAKLVAEGIEVVLTRRGDVYVPLRARTELANRVGADLFLSIHANAAEDPEARGIETYYLDFATDPTAKAVAARENAASGDSMHDLQDLVRSIAMSNKIDESRELARLVQRDLVAGVRQSRPDAQDLGVKQAPFMVLIGATMPSVLTEISFLTNEEAAAHLATSVYRDQIADALFASVVGYQRALKPVTRVAANDN